MQGFTLTPDMTPKSPYRGRAPRLLPLRRRAAQVRTALRRMRPPPGVPGPPDFVGVGSQRCGTTWWFDLINAHPMVATARDKERHFFARFCAEPMTEADVESYRRSFYRGEGQIAGEWTPRYAYDFWTPPLLYRAAPEAKLLFLVRDPVARLRSGVEHQARLTPPWDAPQLAQICREAGTRGLYAEPLRRMLDWFPREQLLVLQYERCVAGTAGEL